MAFEFHISKAARDHYEFDRTLFQTSGNVIIPDFPAARAFAKRMNDRADKGRYPDRVVHAAELNAMGLIDEICHHAIEIYRRTVNPTVMADAVAAVTEQLGEADLDAALAHFVEQFPPLAVYLRGTTAAEYLDDDTDGIPNREIGLEELLLLWLANANPAFQTFDELFDDADLAERTSYTKVIDSLRAFFDGQPSFGPEEFSLIAFLRAPALAEPNSLAAQLRYIRTRWGLVLTPFLDRLVVSLDVLHEEEVALWMRFHPQPGPGTPTGGPGLGTGDNEYERFSTDRDWMPRVVLLAKTTFVWLDQLSKRYGRWIHRLDEIPDGELEALARRGFNALWLIGLWERSKASQRIKQWRGNPEAAASAYSLMEYRIADELGGEEAFRNLRDRCAQRGIRLSSDMVPNHMGIDSRWVIEHPDWFLSLPDSPYPAYSFTGGNLADDERVTVQIEDHYWNNTDAAVVFKRTDTWTGDARYIYHGNDGTSMPWNDTAQLDYLNPEAREAVIQTILHVARQFPIIRFDAAMTLARRHIQRLWYPEPGQGGAIPSRAEHALPRAVFDERMPNEFWREVVDRVALEAPDTLLLAEAFWLLEGYFVRTLGMHRVYNSAFMNMLRDEDNASYRKVIKDTIEFDPEVLKRYVNFMSNPDERTAVDQFGKGDKYFGVCTLMATLPGLPMVGHGQIEGFAEKYGMEYRKAYRDEQPDGWLIERHEREIFPLFHRRYLFSGVSDFLLYDVFDPAGWVNEDIFAYSNLAGDERSLVVYHNKYAEASGWIKTSAAYSVPTDGGGSGGPGGRRLVRRSLGEGLGLHPDGNWFTLLREQSSGLQFIRRSSDLCRDGMYVELHAYGCQVFLDVHEVEDVDGRWARLAERLGGAGVASVEVAMRDIALEPVHSAVRGLVEGGTLLRLTEVGAARAVAGCPAARPVDLGLRAWRPGISAKPSAASSGTETETLIYASVERVAQALRAAAEVSGSKVDVDAATSFFRARLVAALSLPEAGDEELCAGLRDSWAWIVLFGYLVSEALTSIVDGADGPDGSAGSGEPVRPLASTDPLELAPVLAVIFRDLGLDDQEAWRVVGLVRMLRTLPLPASAASLREAVQPAAMVRLFLEKDAVRAYMGINVWEDVTWFSRECFNQVLWWMFALETLDASVVRRTQTRATSPGTKPGTQAGVTAAWAKAAVARPDPARLAQARRLTKALARAAEHSGYQLDKLEPAAAER